MNDRRVFILAGLAVAAYIVWRIFRVPDELSQHLASEKDLQGVGTVATEAGVDSLANWPLTVLGDSPLAGVIFDPFNKGNPGSKPKPLDMYPGLINF